MPTRHHAGALFAVAVFAMGIAHSQDGPDHSGEYIKSFRADLAANPQSADTKELLIFLQPDQSAAGFAAANRLTLQSTLRSDGHAHVFSAPSAAAATDLLKSLSKNPAIRSVFLNERTQNVRMSFVPNDPYFPKDGGGAGQPGQWHLQNQHVAGRDARVVGAWNDNYTGQGVTIGIIDDGLETAHPDLAPNYMAADSFNFGSYVGAGAANDPNPFRNTSASNHDRHGTSVAGVAAARGGNGIGGTGAAPMAGLSGLRVDFPEQTTAMFVDATLFHSSGTNTNIAIKNHSYGISAPFIPNSAQRTALGTSAAAGTIHLVAAGNDRGTTGEDANKKELQNSPDAITVAAFGSDGKFASYSNFGANIFVTAPSSSSTGFGITTTDRTGVDPVLAYNYGYNDFPGDLDHTDIFGGTSSATPLVAGVMALVKQAQPALDTRFAKHLLVMTSDVVDLGDASATGGWITNGAGNEFNPNYGFGLIDAAELTTLATQFSGVTALQTASSGSQDVSLVIPDANVTGVTDTIAIDATGQLEEVMVTLDITHTWRGDVEAFLTSPTSGP
jgi:subtilisin family serine protease